MSLKRKIYLRTLSLFLLFSGMPYIAVAAVRINEIAWMGGVTSSAGEWIELVNDSETPVSLSGWRIDASESSPDLSLSGVIGANSHFLIERMTDGAVPDISADLVVSFGAGLSNEGETLQLKDGNGVPIDIVIGGKNWVTIGGDNGTKQTPQRVEGSVDDWTTGAPTPRAPNIRPSGASVANPETSLTTLNLKNQKIIESTGSASTGVPVKANPRTSASEELPARSAETTVLWEGSEASSGVSGFFVERNTKWFFLFFGTVLAVLAGLIIVRSARREVVSTDEYAIIEDIIESADD